MFKTLAFVTSKMVALVIKISHKIQMHLLLKSMVPFLLPICVSVCIGLCQLRIKEIRGRLYVGEM